MKRKIIMGLLTALTVGVLLVGCGNGSDVDNTPNNTTNSETTNNDTDKDTTTNESESEIGGSVGDIIGDTETTEETTEVEVLVKTYTFPASSAATGYTVKTIEDENVDWSKNETYTVLPNGRIMTFKWESPESCGSKVYASTTSIYLKNYNEALTLEAWSGIWSKDDYNEAKEMSKEDIVSINAAIPYVENGYYDMEVTDTTIRITFAVDNTETKVKGYACYIIDNNNETTYYFNYTETYDFYNDARAMDVVNSIEYVELPAEPNVE